MGNFWGSPLFHLPTFHIVFFYVLYLFEFFFNWYIFRELLLSFLLTKRNIKGAKKIHLQQTKKDRFTLLYIKNYAMHKEEFAFFYTLKIIYIVISILMFLSGIVAAFFSLYISNILLVVAWFLQIAFAAYIYSQFNRGHVTRFDKRYKDYLNRRN